MPSNERENQRIENKKQKEKKAKRIIWIALFVVLAVLLALKVCEIDFADIKNRINSLSVTSAVSDNNYPVTVNVTNGESIKLVNGKLYALNESSVVSVDPASASQSYTFDHGYASPVFKSNGNYTCLFDRGGTRLRLDTTSEELYEKSFDKSIITADVANNGTIACALFSDEAKSRIIVLNKNENKKLDYNVKDGYVTYVSLNQNASLLAYTSVNSKNAFLTTTVHILNIGSGEDEFTLEYDKTNIIDLHFNDSGNLYVLGDNFLSVIKSQKKEEVVFKKGSISTINYCYTSSNELVINYSGYNKSSKSKVAYIKSNGKVKSSFSIKGEAKSISSSSNEITVLLPQKICIYSLTKGEKKESISCDSSVNSAVKASSRVYVQYGQYIDIAK